MKKLSLFLCLQPLFCFAQILPKNADSNYGYSAVVNVDSASADELYSRAKEFVALNFKSGKDVTQLNDDNTKTVIGKGNIPENIKVGIGAPIDCHVGFTFQIACKDGRYKYDVSHFVLKYNTQETSFEDSTYWNKNRSAKKIFTQLQEQTDQKMKDMIASLEKAMNEKKDW